MSNPEYKAILEFNSLQVYDYIEEETKTLKKGNFTTLELSYKIGILSGILTCLVLQEVISQEKRVEILNKMNEEVLGV